MPSNNPRNNTKNETRGRSVGIEEMSPFWYSKNAKNTDERETENQETDHIPASTGSGACGI